MRHAFIQALCDAAKENPRIMLLTGDVGYRILESFHDQYPDRYLNVGVAEANLVTVAAGLAMTGFIPFAYTIATFLSMRPFEQIRNDVSLQHVPVKLVGTAGGVGFGKAGATHHAVEDIALMRLLTNIAIISPADAHQAYNATQAIIAYPGPCYLRLDRPATQTLFDRSMPFQIGKGIILTQGRDIALVATGSQIFAVRAAADLLARSHKKPSVVHMPTIQPLDSQLIGELARDHSLIVTVEEHRRSGGLGSAVLECITDHRYQTEVVRIGISDTLERISMSYDRLVQHWGLTPQGIVDKIQSHLLLR